MRARSLAGLSLLAIVVWWWSGDDPAPRHHGETAPQVAVLHDGFVVMRGDGHGTLRLSELGHDGTPRRELEVASPGDELRVVGTRSGAGVAWRDPAKKQLRVGIVDRNGRLRDTFTGDGAATLCDGLASNDHRFAVGWLNEKGGMWFVTGPTQPAIADVEVTAPVSWCAITGAGDGVGILLRERNALRINLCRKGKCPMLETVGRPIAERPILAFGCIATHCVVVTRGSAGRAEATMLTRRGGVTWTRPLPGDVDGDVVTAIGAGDDHFVIAYGVSDRDGHRAEVIAIDSKGDLSTIWRSPAARSTVIPAIAWSRGQLAIARLSDGAVVTDVVPLPRVNP
jgi:hypothetical protein